MHPSGGSMEENLRSNIYEETKSAVTYRQTIEKGVKVVVL